MGRIKKVAGPKHEATISKAISDFAANASSIPVTQLPSLLRSFPQKWPLPRGDLYHWIPLLNRFDNILDQIIQEYGLDQGPQSKAFGTVVLERGVAGEATSKDVVQATSEDIESQGFKEDGDRQLAEEVLHFSRTLLENCGNRSLYASSERLGDLLNTTSLPLLGNVLLLMVRLAQRYHASRQRSSNVSQSFTNALLASHYNIELEKVQKLAEPFVKQSASEDKDALQSSSKKGKEKVSAARRAITNLNANNFLELLKGTPTSMNGSAKSPKRKVSEYDHREWDDWGSVSIQYFRDADKNDDSTPGPRRASTFPKTSRLANADGSPGKGVIEDDSGTAKTTSTTYINISSSRIQQEPLEQIVSDSLLSVPKDVKYDVLCRLRVAQAVTQSLATRAQIISIRLLALTNLAYIYGEETFKQKILQRDSDEPRPLQIVQQLCDLLSPPSNTDVTVPLGLQTTVLGTLEAFAKLKSKAADVCAALSINVNHGVLFQLLRSAVAEMRSETSEDADSLRDDWREAGFALLETLPQCTPRAGESLISAGLLGILVEVLNLRSSQAERSFPKTLTFLNNLVGPVRDAFETLASANGLEAISGLLQHEVNTALEKANAGLGLPKEYRNRVTDYRIPFYSQQTLRMIFKITREMMNNNTGNFSRLLRNFIESPTLLGGLQTVVVNPNAFGSSVWSGAVNIMSSFIHNEPTSYTVVSEAGLSQGLLDTLSTRQTKDESEVNTATPGNQDEGEQGDTQDDSSDDIPPTHPSEQSTERLMSILSTEIPDQQGLLDGTGNVPKGILPAGDAIISIPHALGALCLNHAGMALLNRTNALENFFRIFESPSHVKTMSVEQELAQVLGSSFEQLVRHHPALRMPVLEALITMILRVKTLCQAKGIKSDSGAKLWLQRPDAKSRRASAVQSDVDSGRDVIMSDANAETGTVQRTLSADEPLQPQADTSDHSSEPTILDYFNAAVKFLSGIVENHHMVDLLGKSGAADELLEFATLPVMRYDCQNHMSFVEFWRVLRSLADKNPATVLPAVVQRTRSTLNTLRPLLDHDNDGSFFAEFTTPDKTAEASTSAMSKRGTEIARALVHAHTLCNILSEVVIPSFSRTQPMPFAQVNLTDVYVEVIKDLGLLHRICVWEDILLMKRLPSSWAKSTPIKGHSMGSMQADEALGVTPSYDTMPGVESTHGSADTHPSGNAGTSDTSASSKKSPSKVDRKSATFRNTRTLRFLLSQVPSSIISLLQNLGKAISGKRRSHSSDGQYTRQSAIVISEAISTGLMSIFAFEPPGRAMESELHTYWMIILSSLTNLMIEGDGAHQHVLTLLLFAFKKDGGLTAVKDMLEAFSEQMQQLTSPGGKPLSADSTGKLLSAHHGIEVILDFYKPILAGKPVVESPQSTWVLSSDSRSNGEFYFNPKLLLIDLRAALLPVVRSLWDSAFVEKAPSSIIKKVIEIMKTILDASEEHGAPRSTPEPSKKAHKVYEPDSDKVESLVADGIEEDRAREALYRCFNSMSSAETYCQRLKHVPDAKSFPIPDYDIEPTTTDEAAPDADQPADSTQAAGADHRSTMGPDVDQDTNEAAASLALLSQGERPQAANASEPAEASTSANNTRSASNTRTTSVSASNDAASIEDEGTDPMAMSLDLDNLQNVLPDMQAHANELIAQIGQNFPAAVRTASRSIPRSSQPTVPSTSLDELNTGRGEIRKTLIDRGLDVLNVHDDVSFELSDLVTAATLRAGDAKGFRTEVGQTLIQSLISFELDEDDPSTGKKIASYANLLALVLQTKDFFDACSTELKENFEYLTSFVKLTNNVQAGVQSSPWICQTLLVIEKVLSEDAQPPQIKSPSAPDGQITFSDIVDFEPPLVSREAKSDLFEALLKLMPYTGRDEAMVLSITRILVILTRDRTIASHLTEKKNIQRFFLMIKQLSGIKDDKLPGTVMIVIRHMFETEDIIRRVMNTEIRASQISRATRSPDLMSFVKSMHHLAIRSPDIFAEAANESLELYPYEPSNPKHSMIKLRSEVEDQISDAIHKTEKILHGSKDDSDSKKADGNSEDTADKSASAEVEASASAPKGKATDKIPTIETPSGVVHYLVSELLSYKDTDDSVSHGPRMIRPPITPRSSEGESTSTPTTSDTRPEQSPIPTSPAVPDAKKNEFKPEQHPIHTYRCFILQCLTEVLQSYNQAKVELINFSRKLDNKASTPSKPRSTVLNYLLTEAIPVGPVGTEETMTYKKRDITSNWAISVIVALCMRSSEDNAFTRDENYDIDQVELTYVRKFVLDHALKAFKDAAASDEDLSPKYGRLLDLADLFNRLLTGQLPRGVNSSPGADGSQKAIAKIMFEKGFIAALTNSISDINLGFKGADRAIKYILRPLNKLTSAAIELSELSDISTSPDPSDEGADEVSSATSNSEVDHAREDTPDLFRNSTLGMFEHDRDGGSSSESSRSEDEEMDYDEYDDGMDYDDQDPEDLISDEEDEIDGIGHIEGLDGNHHMDVIIDEDGDDEDTEDDDEDDDEDDEDEDEEMGDLEEVNADNDNASLDDDNGAEWEDEPDMEEGELHDDDFEDDDEPVDIEDMARDIIEDAGGPGAALQRLEGLDGGNHADLVMDVATGRYMNDVIRPDNEEDDDDEDDDDGEDMDDDEGPYDDYDDGAHGGIPARVPDWGWDDEDETFVLDHHRRHHHPSSRRLRTHQLGDPWTIFPNGHQRIAPPFHRSHRSGAPSRAVDDGVNPLLQRADRAPSSTPMMRDQSGFSEMLLPQQGGGPLAMDPGGLFIRQVLQSLGSGDGSVQAVPGPGGNWHIQITGRPGDVGSPLSLLRLSNFPHQGHSHPTEPSRSESRTSLASFTPQGVLQRWAEEAKILFSNDAQNRATRVTNTVLRLMVPVAEEKKKQREAEEKRLREEAEKQKEQEKKEREERERKEKEEREKKEAEELAEAAAAAQLRAEAEAEAVARSQPAAGTEGIASTSSAEPMEGVEQSDAQTDRSGATDAGQAGDSTPTVGIDEPVERQHVMFNGTQLDITDMGIDRAYLDALPEEIRNEVLMSQLAVQRAQTAAAGEPPTEIDNEFLEALPPEIRAELLQQEAQERRRRERQEAQRQQAAAGGAPRAEEMDPASFFASLDPAIRQTVLMEQDDDMLAQLPPQLAEEARALMGGRAHHRLGTAARMAQTARREQMLSGRHLDATKKPPRKPIVQILDKAGVATLLRLMFIQLPGNVQDPLQKIFEDAVQNRQNRAEIITMLLSLLNEGSIDASAMERSYALLSARSKQPSAQKTPLKRTTTDTSVATVSSLQELKCTPLSIIHQCLAILLYLVTSNLHLPSFFLNEVDASSLSKGKSSKKGKAKETKASRYPINLLLGLLDRSLVTENVVCVERLADLLQRITFPLLVHWKKENEALKEEERKKTAAANAATQADGEAQATSNQNPADGAPTSDGSGPAAPNSSEQMSDVQPTGPTEATSNVTLASQEKPAPSVEGQEKEAVKKTRTNVSPVIPQENLALVINVITARECPSTTFRATLSTMTNLSILPGAKEVFGQRLVASALDLGELVLGDLNELIPQIKSTATGKELKAVALTKFSPQSSDQAKLLRILKALDYLFDAKREETKAKTDSENNDGAEAAQSSKADLVTTLYENSTFSLLWDRLSECLRAINQTSGMLNVATILLPLVEALMVVCTNTTTKEAPLAKFVKEFTVSSPAPESQMESIFFRFTEEHRKILNELVRHNPKLMSGTFQLLVKNPKVLDFDNKRNYFGRRLHQRDTQTRHPQPPLQLNVRRDQVFLDSFKFLSFKSGDEIKYGKLNIRFSGEDGVDAGGVTREWFQVMSRQMFNPDYALFIPVASDRTTFHPSKLSKINEEHLMFFKFIGRIIGKALYEGRALDCHFSRAVYKRILGKTVSIKDMETLDLDYYKSLLWMLENDITEIITETMSVETDDFGVTEIVDLVPNGRNIPVSEENKHEYVQLVVEHRLVGSVEEQLQKFLEGFHDIVSPSLISIFNEQELELLISGLPDIDVDDWKSHTDYHNYSASSPQIQWFWRAVRSFDKEERAKLLQFVTGTSKVPLNGFGQLEGMNGFSRFNIHRDYGNKDRLPSSHTCFNQLDLPEYEDYEALRKRLYTAMTAGSEYFGFA